MVLRINPSTVHIRGTVLPSCALEGLSFLWLLGMKLPNQMLFFYSAI